MIISNKLITNSGETNFLNVLKTSINQCEKFYFSVAFVSYGGVQLLIDTLKDAQEQQKIGRILTSTYLNFSDPGAIKKLKSFSNVDLKIFVRNKDFGFHPKVYVFENKDDYKIIIGSSNLTKTALMSNIEWNIEVVSKKEVPFVEDVLREYDVLWDESEEATEELLEQYNEFYKEVRNQEKRKQKVFNYYKAIKPNKMQREAISNLERFRGFNEKRSLAVAATGTGKTFLAAFDVKSFNPKKLLFVVHRKEILEKAKESFEKVLNDSNKKTGFFTSLEKQDDVDYLFAMIQTLNNHFERFDQEEFDYIVIDEAHHATSPSYEKILNYFKPKFLLGMTATPERCDNGNIFDIFDNNVAINVRMREALEEELVAPFHYFGITDIDAVDLSDVDIDDVSELTRILKVNERVDFILEKMNQYGFDGIKRKCLGFCASREHAEYMSDEFNKRGIPSYWLTGEDSGDKRLEYINKLENDEHELEVLFTVDIFNEGVDIPSVNTVLMLRPTKSPIVFIQQLGRGLRKHTDKEFLTVLDFIGNHNRAYLVAIALNGSRFYDKESLMVAVKTGFSNAPGGVYIQMDKIVQERILAQLDRENFNSMKYLKDDYYEFKHINKGEIPRFLQDYLKYENAPDPISFIENSRTYLDFLSKVERDADLKSFVKDVNFDNVLRELSSKLPLKRVHEFCVLNYLINNEEIEFDVAFNEVGKIMEYVDLDTLLHSFECLNQNFYDVSQTTRNIKLIDFSNGKLKRTVEFSKLLENEEHTAYIKDVIHYGIQRYQKEFQSIDYGVPFFKLYEQYKMTDAALLSNYRKIHSSFRGQGLLTHGKEYFLFVDLHKSEDIKESINYKDKILDKKYFQWQTPNATTSYSDRGQKIIKNRVNDVKLHLFVRKFSKLDGSSQPFIYLGKGNSVDNEGEKPITVRIELENELPEELFIELTVKV